MRRHLLGIISLLLLAAAAYGLVRFGTKESHAEFLSSVCLRGGLVLGAIWLALPQLIRLFKSTSPWFVGLLVRRQRGHRAASPHHRRVGTGHTVVGRVALFWLADQAAAGPLVARQATRLAQPSRRRALTRRSLATDPMDGRLLPQP